MHTKEQLEEMGRGLANTLNWNGDQILTVAIEALTDANFHMEADILKQMLSAIENCYDTPQFKLEVVCNDIPLDGSQSTAFTLSDEPLPTEQKPAPPQGG